MFEFYYHPENFKKNECPYYSEKKLCKLGAKCFRYHELQENEIWRCYWNRLKAEEKFLMKQPSSRKHSGFIERASDLSDLRKIVPNDFRR